MTQDFEALYQVVFFATAVALVALERFRALQRQPVQIANRWTGNIGLFVIGSVVNTLLLPIGIYAFAQQQPPGLLSRPGLPFAAQLLLTFLLLDLWRYWEHRLWHRIPLLWRLHLVHHSDTQIDVTTSERHHPLEVVVGTLIMMGLVAAFGMPAAAVGLYLLIATVVALYSHANLQLHSLLDRPLRQLIVTPSVHAFHHSDRQAQTDSNYGSVLTLWDRLFGTYVDPGKASMRRFGLGYFRLPADARLGRMLKQPLLFRPGMVDVVQLDASDLAGAAKSPRAAMSRRSKEAVLGGIAGCILVCVAMWPTLLGMMAAWQKHEAYQYAWLVLPMLVYLLGWHHRSTGLSVSPRSDLSGIPVVIFAAACWGAATLMNVDVGRQTALILALQGVAMSTLGWRSYRALFPTLALAFLMVPYGDLLEPSLRVLTVKAIDLFAVAAQLPHHVEGFVVFIGTHRYIVVDECSGLPFVTLGLFLGYSFGLLLYRSALRILALALFGAFLGVVSNVVRVNAIVLIDWMRGSQMPLTAHAAIQWVALFATLGLLFYVLSRLHGEMQAAIPPVDAPTTVHPVRRLGPVLAGLSMLVIGGSAAALPSNQLRPSRGLDTGLLVPTIAGWELVKPAPVWTIDGETNTESIELTYRHGGGEIRVVVIEPLSSSTKLPESRLVPRDQGVWRQKQIEREAACAGVRCVSLLHSTWQHDKGDELRHVYYAYSIGNFATESKLAIRAAQGWRRLTGTRGAPRLIGFVSDDAVTDLDQLGAAFERIRSAVEVSDRG